ncbi:MAG: hypothetical protein U0V48_19455 [Anaerolineales bacterium]
MKNDLFDKLITSVRDGGKILRGETKPSRVFVLGASKDKKAHAKLQLAQKQKRLKAS